jgi:ubiquinone biosynthesis protein
VAPFPWEEAERIFREETGRPFGGEFDALERRPVATASIGQVYVAWKGGVKLAVKVQRPAVETDFAGDIRLMVAMLGIIRRLRLKRLFWMIEPMSEFVGWTREELDYRNEARYMERLRANAGDNPWEQVPAVWLATRRVLVADFLEGITVLDYLRAVEAGDEVRLHRLGAAGFDAHALGRRMIDNFLGDAFHHGIFHADLHPANLMILPGNVVGYIDFGITGVLSQYSRHHLVMMTLAYTRADPEGMGSSFLKVSTLDAGADLQAFRDGLKRFAEVWYERQGRQSRLRKNFTLVMLDMLKLSRATGVWPERDVIKYIRSAIAIDGLITRFAPGFDVGAYLEAVCDRHLRLAARQALFRKGQWIEWTRAGSHLLRDGALRAAAALDRFSAAGWPGSGPRQGEPKPKDTLPSRGLQALRVSAIAFGVSSLMAVRHEPIELGANLFTAEALLCALSLTLLGWSVYRIPGRQPQKEAYRA